MIRRQVAIVDYGIGNQMSVLRLVRSLGHRCVVTHEPAEIEAADLVILPGVGAYPAAMKTLHETKLFDVIRARARADQPLLGICLGMQLLTDSSEELGQTAGLSLIPGQIKTLKEPRWHIGWNALEATGADESFRRVDRDSFYFNHSYAFDGPSDFVVATARADSPIVAAIRRGKVVGVQFHPEKSQDAGRRFLGGLVDDLCVGTK